MSARQILEVKKKKKIGSKKKVKRVCEFEASQEDQSALRNGNIFVLQTWNLPKGLTLGTDSINLFIPCKSQLNMTYNKLKIVHVHFCKAFTDEIQIKSVLPFMQ